MDSDDIERGDAGRIYGDKQYQPVHGDESIGEEQESLLATEKTEPATSFKATQSSTSLPKLLLAFAGGVGACFAFQYAFPSLCLGTPSAGDSLASFGHAGSPVVSAA